MQMRTQTRRPSPAEELAADAEGLEHGVDGGARVRDVVRQLDSAPRLRLRYAIPADDDEEGGDEGQSSGGEQKPQRHVSGVDGWMLRSTPSDESDSSRTSTSRSGHILSYIWS